MVKTKTAPLLPLICLLIVSTEAFASDMRYKDPTIYYVLGFLALCLVIVLLQFLVAYVDHFTARRSMEEIITEAYAKQNELQKMVVGVSTSKTYSEKEESK